MSDNTTIEWTEATWNPIRAGRRDGAPGPAGGWRDKGWHCERVSPGCQHCYAETLNEKRFGTGLPYNRKSRDLVEVYLDEKTLTQPLHWRRPRKVFVCSMTDLFGEWVPDEMIDRVFAVMALSPQHTFQVLTKRPERMRAYLTKPFANNVYREHQLMAASRITGVMTDYLIRLPGTVAAFNRASAHWDKQFGGDESAGFVPLWPLPNVWLGTSVEDQERADERIPELLATPAAVRFLSCEPLLGPLDLDGWLWRPGNLGEPVRVPDNFISWVIVGGESGPGARPCDLAWIRNIVQQCQAAGTAVFCKQLGAKPTVDLYIDESGAMFPTGEPQRLRLRDRKGGDPAEWPEDLRVREFPEVRHA